MGKYQSHELISPIKNYSIEEKKKNKTENLALTDQCLDKKFMYTMDRGECLYKTSKLNLIYIWSDFTCEKDYKICYCGCINNKCVVCKDFWKYLILKKKWAMILLLFLCCYTAFIIIFVSIMKFHQNFQIKKITEEDFIEIDNEKNGVHFFPKYDLKEGINEVSFDSISDMLSHSKKSINDHERQSKTNGNLY